MKKTWSVILPWAAISQRWRRNILILNELGDFYFDSTELRLYLSILNDYQTYDYLRLNKELRGPTSTFIQEYRKDYPH